MGDCRQHFRFLSVYHVTHKGHSNLEQKKTTTYLKCIIQTVHSHTFSFIGFESSQIAFFRIQNSLFPATRCWRSIWASTTATCLSTSTTTYISTTCIVTLGTRVCHVWIEGLGGSLNFVVGKKKKFSNFVFQIFRKKI